MRDMELPTLESIAATTPTRRSVGHPIAPGGFTCLPESPACSSTVDKRQGSVQKHPALMVSKETTPNRFRQSYSSLATPPKL